MKGNHLLRKANMFRFLLILLFILFPTQWAIAQLTVKVPSTTLGIVIKQIKQQSDYQFFYDDNLSKVQVSALDVKDVSIEELFDVLLENKDISYKVEDNIVYLSSNNQSNSEQSQAREVKGTVVDPTGEPLIGVNVKVKGQSTGTITDFDGNFVLNVKGNSSILVFSYVGYTTKEIAVKNKTILNVTLEDDTQLISEVVVTALGIKKETKALTYNVQEIKSDEIVGVKDANFMNSLAGKIAGVQINTSSSGIGGSAKVVMRGAKSISGNNNALYVVDGIPLPSLQTTQPSDMFTGMGQSGDGISSINPDDIESMSILSGAAAAALYGNEAANGVVMITTKKGQDGGTSINVSNSTTFSSPFIMPEFQNTYGNEPSSYKSWGQKLEVPTDYDPADFFQTGYNLNNSVSLSTGTKKNQTYFSASSLNARGIINNNDLDRYNVSFRNSSLMFNDKLHVDLGFMFMNTKEKNMLAQGQYFNPLVPLYLFPRGDDIEKYKLFERYNPSRNFKTQYWPYGDLGIQAQNPYWITQRDLFENHKDRFLISAGLKYDLTSWMNISGRAKYDTNKSINEKKYSASTSGLFAGDTGAYFKDDFKTTQMYADFMLNINKYIGDFSLTATLGTSIKDVQYTFHSFGGNLSSVPNMFIYNNLNLSTARVLQNEYHDQNQAIFATAQVGYKSLVYLDVTGRNDWNSALAGTNYTSIFYPSVGLSTILTDLLPIKSDVLSFLKARISYSEVGNAPQRFKSIPTYPIVDGFAQTTTFLPNKDLEPEKTRSYEFGINANFWQDKIKFGLTLYTTQTFNQFFNPSLSASSGFSNFYVNGGRVDNKGIELSLGLNQKLGKVDWNSNFTYSLNRNKIVQLLPEFKAPNGEIVSKNRLDMGGTDAYRMILTNGGSMGDIYVSGLKVDEHGYINVDINSRTVQTNPNEFMKAGNANPLYTMGWRNNFAWKGFNLGFLINARVGGIGVSATQALMDAYGVSKESAEARDNGGALVNGELIPAQSFYETIGGGKSGVGSMYTYSATNVRLAEVSLGYDVPLAKDCKWLKGLHFSLIGRNLLMFYNKAPYDPELTASTGTYFQGIDYFMQPSLRNVGFSIKAKF